MDNDLILRAACEVRGEHDYSSVKKFLALALVSERTMLQSRFLFDQEISQSLSRRWFPPKAYVVDNCSMFNVMLKELEQPQRLVIA